MNYRIKSQLLSWAFKALPSLSTFYSLPSLLLCLDITIFSVLAFPFSTQSLFMVFGISFLSSLISSHVPRTSSSRAHHQAGPCSFELQGKCIFLSEPILKPDTHSMQKEECDLISLQGDYYPQGSPILRSDCSWEQSGSHQSVAWLASYLSPSKSPQTESRLLRKPKLWIVS